jgi:hypothetical protein
MRRLVFCFDGSWNKLSASRRPTNVVLLAESVIPVTKLVFSKSYITMRESAPPVTTHFAEELLERG